MILIQCFVHNSEYGFVSWIEVIDTEMVLFAAITKKNISFFPRITILECFDSLPERVILHLKQQVFFWHISAKIFYFKENVVSTSKDSAVDAF